MGLERADCGVHPDDVVSVLKGHIKDGYKVITYTNTQTPKPDYVKLCVKLCNTIFFLQFKSEVPCSDDDPEFIKEPTLDDRTHCLLSIIPANVLPIMEDEDFKKLKLIRKKASDIGK